MIDVVRTVAPQVPFSCEEGYCGSCETGVVDGLPCHRDTILTDEERASNETMMICVGRALSKRITLDVSAVRARRGRPAPRPHDSFRA